MCGEGGGEGRSEQKYDVQEENHPLPHLSLSPHPSPPPFHSFSSLLSPPHFHLIPLSSPFQCHIWLASPFPPLPYPSSFPSSLPHSLSSLHPPPITTPPSSLSPHPHHSHCALTNALIVVNNSHTLQGHQTTVLCTHVGVVCVCVCVCVCVHVFKSAYPYIVRSGNFYNKNN